MFRQGAVLVYIILNSEICLLLFGKGIDGDAERGELFARDGVVDLARDTDDAGTKLRAVIGEAYDPIPDGQPRPRDEMKVLAGELLEKIYALGEKPCET